MKKLALLTFIFMLFAFVAVAQNSETRNVSGFTVVKSKGSINIELEKGSSEKVVITGSGTDLSNVITKVDGDELTVRMKDGNYRNIKITVKVYYKNLNEVKLAGSGHAKALSTLKSDDLTIKLTGSGGFSGEVEAKSLTVKLSGSGSINIEGSADNQELDISGSGGIKAEDLKGKDVTVRISGSGGAKVWATESIDASISGSGGVRYKGNPERVASKSVGSGKIRQI